MKSRVGRADRRGPCRGHALARHVPFDRREDPAPPCRAGAAPQRFHHPRHRRPDPPAEADRRRGQHRREALAGAPARLRHRRLEEPRPLARQSAGRRGLFLRQRQGPRALRRIPAAAEDAERRRFRRSAAPNACASSASGPTCSPISSAASATCWSTNTRTPTSPSISGCACSPRATSNICCVGDDDQSIYGWRGAEVDNILRFERDFPGAVVIRLERNYRSTGHILGAASGLIAHNEGRLGKTLFTDTAEMGEKVAVVSGWDSSEEARAIGDDIEQAQRQRPFAERDGDPGARLLPDARVRGALHHARAELPRHRRPALLRAHGDPRRARLSPRHRQPGRRPRLRAHRQHAEARPRRLDHPAHPSARTRAATSR